MSNLMIISAILEHPTMAKKFQIVIHYFRASTMKEVEEETRQFRIHHEIDGAKFIDLLMTIVPKELVGEAQ